MNSIARSSGILAPLFSLPGVRDVGALGRCAREFVDFLADAKQSWLQLLPVNPTDEHGSPYAGLSAFAGETLYLDLDEFHAERLLDDSDLDAAWRLPARPRKGDSSIPQRDARSERVDYAAARRRRRPCWEKAYARYAANQGGERYRREEERFREENKDWVDDFALYQTAIEIFREPDWSKWPQEIRKRDPRAIAEFAQTHKERVDYHRFLQLVFDVQWREFREYCALKKVRLFGDVPIYVGRTSADVWTAPELFQVDDQGRIVREAGVPSDDFNPDGQPWGSPVYRWERHKEDDFAWHRRRMRKTLSRFDVVRLDHFIGYYNFYSFPGEGIDPATGVKGGAPVPASSVNGRVYDKGWEPGPQEAFFDAIFSECPKEAFVAEDLGVMNKGVEELRDRYDLPGMQVFQFSFGGVKIDPKTNCAPNPLEKWSEKYVAYTGTHDGAPILGWLDDARRFAGTKFMEGLDFQGIENVLERYRKQGDKPALIPAERSDENFVQEFFRKPRGFNRPKMGVSRKFRPMADKIAALHAPALRAVMQSPCVLAIFPIQDAIGLSNDSRINYPGIESNNWTWRLADSQLTPELIAQLRTLTEESRRA